MTDSWKHLEVEYGRRIRAASREERRALYSEAVSRVAALRNQSLPSDPANRTVGTSDAAVHFLLGHCGPDHAVLEVGCGAGYTCWKLAPHVGSIVATDICGPRLEDARELLREQGVQNATIRKVWADELLKTFGPESFDRVISVDVYEHLHSEDGRAHLRDACAVLKPGGKYILITVNRHVGPTDITRDIFPDETAARGFHFNETTFADLDGELRMAGFSDVRAAWRAPKFLPFCFQLNHSVQAGIRLEQWCARHPSRICKELLRPFLTINLIATK